MATVLISRLFCYLYVLFDKQIHSRSCSSNSGNNQGTVALKTFCNEFWTTIYFANSWNHSWLSTAFNAPCKIKKHRKLQVKINSHVLDLLPKGYHAPDQHAYCIAYVLRTDSQLKIFWYVGSEVDTVFCITRQRLFRAWKAFLNDLCVQLHHE